MGGALIRIGEDTQTEEQWSQETETENSVTLPHSKEHQRLLAPTTD